MVSTNIMAEGHCHLAAQKFLLTVPCEFCPMSHQDDYNRLIEAFQNLPILDFSKDMATVNGLKFVFPRMSVPEAVRQEALSEVNSNSMSNSSTSPRSTYRRLDSLPPDEPSGMASIEVLLEAIEKASGKLEYGRTPLLEWEERLVFGDDEASITRSDHWDIRKSTTDSWARGKPINASKGVANDWFRNELVAGVEDGRFPDGLVIHGAAGSGKSTLLKYLIQKNFSWLKEKRLVFSRFELLKFWQRIKDDPKTRFEREAQKYLAVIHARDLLVHRFCTFSSEDGFRVDLSPGVFPHDPAKPPKKKKFNVELEIFLKECDAEFSHQGCPTTQQTRDRIRDTVSRLINPQASLANALDELTLRCLHVMIFVLARGKKIVTVYDGLDAVRPEDVLSETKDGTALWECAREVMRLRNVLGSFDQVFDDAPRLIRHSILITRNNTLQGLVQLYEAWTDTVINLPKFQISSVAVLPAAISTARTAITHVPEFRNRSRHDQQVLATLFLRPYVRAMGQIFRGVPGDGDIDRVEDLFDGNLRKLFRLISLSIRWTSQEMLSGDFLDPAEYQSSVDVLLRTLASPRGIDFLYRKSYRTVEVLLVGRIGWFENAVSYRGQQLPASHAIHVGIATNDGHHGVLDNVLNYAPAPPAKSIDDHMLIEKMRYLQVLKIPRTLSQLQSILSDQFGYPSSDEKVVWKKLLFLMKTGFLTVDVAANDEGKFTIATSRRGKLALELVGNLGYIENIFHQSRFPQPLVGHIEDQHRSASTLNWSARSIRNAFIFLSYFKCLEGNPMSGRGVPPDYRELERVQAGLIRSIEAMTKPSLHQMEEDKRRSAEVARLAIQEIELTRSAWRKERLIR